MTGIRNVGAVAIAVCALLTAPPYVRNLAELRAAVAEFVERYNQCWRLEELAYRTPLEAREQYELRHAA